MNTTVGRRTERLDGPLCLSVWLSYELYIGATSIPVSERWDQDADEECNFQRRGQSREQLRIAADTRPSAVGGRRHLCSSSITCDMRQPAGRHENPCVARTRHKLNYDERAYRESAWRSKPRSQWRYTSTSRHAIIDPRPSSTHNISPATRCKFTQIDACQ